METQCAVQSRVVRAAKGSVRRGRGLVRAPCSAARPRARCVAVGAPGAVSSAGDAVSGVRGCERSWSLVFTCAPVFCPLDGGAHETAC